MPNGPTAQEHERSSILDIVSYDLVVDLTGGAATFSSRTEIRFRCKRPGSTSFADLQAARVRRAVLNGANVEIGRTFHPGRLELPRLANENILVVDAEFSYTSAEAGLHHVTGPEGSTCVYSKAYPGALAASSAASTRPTCAPRSRLRSRRLPVGHAWPTDQ